MDANALQVTDYNVKQGVRFTTQGAVHPQFLITFKLGDHGPFTLSYDDKMPEQSVLQADIGKLAQAIRAGSNVTV